MSNVIRKPAVAGMFYPDNPDELKDYIQHMLNINKVNEHFDNIIGIVSPHAGYMYSGNTAAYAYNAIKHLDVENVFVISPSHREFFDGICIYDGDYYQTPLGNIPINHQIADKLINNSSIIFKGNKGHKNEHALEVQLPFLQVIYNNFNIIPIVIGNQIKPYLDKLAESISRIWEDKYLVVVSSDLSHFYDSVTAEKLDKIIVDKINNFDFDGLQYSLETNLCEACGGGGIYTLLKLGYMLNSKNAKVLKRTDSSEVTRDKREVVGYLSAVVYKQ